ncbi:hypothetical protein EV193_102759 [Herbihabitans rhizosphaerae]|uniref:Uncharacterized protein n=1 Tax=Herbihabitans rhizosphaerae TaxID=1872711 RepID=A0A4Q7L2K0_9PSEU|nr:bacteriophage holin [Herbihabitans rhizosphaerae]RZS43778.1 hypothetical protein EV193_102759 [Herbihabitans rhizosphaerae]
MSYLPIIVLLAVGLVLLAFLVVRTLRALGRFSQVAGLVNGHVGDEVGLLKARSAALKVAVAERRQEGSDGEAPRVPSSQ